MLLAGCTGPLSTLDPSGPAAAAIAKLWWVMLAGSIVLYRELAARSDATAPVRERADSAHL